MKIFLTISFLIFIAASSFSQNRSYNEHISKKDSLSLVNYRGKIIQHVNATPDSAIIYAKKYIHLSTELQYGKGIVDGQYLAGQCYKRMQFNDSAINSFTTGLNLSKQITYPSGEAKAYNSLGRTYYLMGKMEESVAACEKAIALTTKFEDEGNLVLADSHIALSTAYARQNQMQAAVQNLLIVDSIHNSASLRPDVIAAAYQNLGNVYLELNEYNFSEEYYIKANDQFKKLPGNVDYYLNTTHINLGRVYSLKNNLAKADSLLTISHDYFSKLKDERTVAEVSAFLGEVKLKKDEFDQAEEYFTESYDIHKKYDRSYEASMSAVELAKLELAQKNPGKAISYLKQAQNLNVISNNSKVTQELIQLFSKSYAQKGDYKQAFLYTNISTKLKDSLQTLQSADRIKELETIYQTEKKDQEIELLTFKNELAEEQKNNQRNLFLGGIGLTSVAGLFFFFLFRNRQKTNKKLKELDAAKSAFFANISHEFRTPLTLIKGPVEDQLESENITPGQRKNLFTAFSNTKRLESLVDQLLALSKLESGNMHLQIQPGNLHQFVRVQAEGFKLKSLDKNVRYSIEIPNEQLDVWFDRDAVQKIVANLLGNAFKYAPDNGEITIKGVQDGDYFEIEVFNSGSYISEENQKDIFVRFYQTSTHNPGTGIGLALTKELLELHQGSIEVRSSQGQGTTFTARLDVVKDHFEPTQILSENLRIKETDDASIALDSSLTTEIETVQDAPILLVIDDNQEIREYINTIFDGIYRVHQARDGKKGLEKAIELIPDIIISDVMMPEMDGFSLTERLKTHELTSHIPIILLTAKAGDNSKLQGIETGADSYLTKPFSSKILVATAQNLIDNRRKLQERFAQDMILQPKEIAVSSADEEFLKRLQVVIDENLTNPDFSSQKFVEEMGVSRMQLHRKLKALSGQSTSEFLRSQRLKAAVQLIKSEKITISEVGYSVGFNDPSYFTKCFRQEFGVSPSEFIKK